MKYALLLVMFLTLSCAQKVLVPLSNGVKADPEKFTAVYEDERVRIKVVSNAWDGYPSDLDSYLTVIFLEVENRSQEEVFISLTDLTVIDDRGKQYNALTPKDASEVARGSSSVGVSVGIGFGDPHWGFGLWGPPYYYDDVSDVVQKAFVGGRILPGKSMSGFVYFQDFGEKVKRIEFRISYTVEGVVYDVTFPFEVKDGKEGADNGDQENRREDS